MGHIVQIIEIQKNDHHITVSNDKKIVTIPEQYDDEVVGTVRFTCKNHWAIGEILAEETVVEADVEYVIIDKDTLSRIIEVVKLVPWSEGWDKPLVEGEFLPLLVELASSFDFDKYYLTWLRY